MSTISNYYFNAQLSQAAYATLQQGMLEFDYVQALIDQNFSTSEATDFAQTYEIISSQPNTPEGFSATVFRNRETNEITFAIRGTEPAHWITDIARADVADIGANGIAATQAIDLFNYYQRLTAVEGQPIYQYGFVNNPLGLPGTPLTVGGAGFVIGSESGIADYTGPLAGERFTAVGHSLGGHLAMILDRLAPGFVIELYTYNAPNFDQLGSTQSTDTFFEQLSLVETYLKGGSIVNTVGFNTSNMYLLAVPEDVISDIGTTPDPIEYHFGEFSSIGNGLRKYDGVQLL